MDPRGTPEKVLTGHPCDQIADLIGNPGTSTSPAATRSISPNRRPTLTAPTQDCIRLNDHQCFRANLATSATTKSKTVDQCDGSMGAGFGYAPAQQSDGAARSLPATARCGSGVRFGRPASLRLAAPAINAGYPQTFKTTNEIERAGYVTEDRGASGQKQGWCIRRKAEEPKTETADFIGAEDSVFERGPWGVATASLVTRQQMMPAALIYRQLLTTSLTVLVNSSRCTNAPSSSASSWSITPPARYSYIVFLERGGTGRVFKRSA